MAAGWFVTTWNLNCVVTAQPDYRYNPVGQPEQPEMWLHDNQIEDISALVANTSLGEGDEVHLTGNPLSDKARNEQIPALQARGVDVTY